LDGIQGEVPAPLVAEIGYFLSTNGWAPVASGGGTVTSVGGTGTVSGIALSGTVTSSGNLTLGGALDLSSPPAIGGTTPAAGTFTNLTTTNAPTFGAALPIASGGTGATSAGRAISNLYGYTTTATAAGTTTLTNASTNYQVFTGTLAQTIVLPVTSTLAVGWQYEIVNNSTSSITVQSSGANAICTVASNTSAILTCIGTALTTAADWEFGFSNFGAITGTGSVVLSNSSTMTGSMNFTGSSTSNSNFGTNITTGTLTIGNTVGTSAIILGRSTGSQYIDIANGATTSSTTASGTASSITTTVLTVGGTVTGVFVVGMQLTGTNVLPYTYITSLGTGTGGAGTYNISQTQTVASTTITGTTQKTISIGTGGLTGSTTAISIGSTFGTSTTINGAVSVGGTTSLGTASAQYIQAVGDALYPQVKAVGSGTDIPLVLQPKGTGALQAQKTDSTATGGNARGVNAVDWQTFRTTAAQVASGSYSSVLAGRNSTASGTDCHSIGAGCNSSGTGSIALSYNAVSSGTVSGVLGGSRGTARGIAGNTVFAASNTPIADVSGNTQAALLVLGRQTTDATATVLASDGSTIAATNQITLPNNSAYYFTGEVIAGVTGAGNTKGWEISGVIKRGAGVGTTALVGSPTVTSLYADAGASTWTVAVTANTTLGCLTITVTGQASTTIRWVAQVRTTEMTF
jgi:hypothetical protein